MNKKKILTMLSLGLVIWINSSVLAQQSGTKDSYLDIVSNPSGATVRLKGDYDLIVTAPCGINQQLSGEYKIKAFKRGYESWSSRVWFNQGNPHQLAIDLKPKNRLKAGLRSALIPGWGQFYCEEKGKSFIMGISTLGAVVAFVFADNDYSNKYDDYVWARNRFDSNKEAEK
ncbi:MAG: PEGA domain-containing protein, partial [candidate division Zixibacteria bacterium]|nr:PEGA domain-containing protein [candidate division Zixibacteria bacterium]